MGKTEGPDQVSPRVSIVIPSLTGDVERARHSVERQTFTDWDLVTMAGLRPAGRARNAGVAATSGELILFLDDDAVLGDERVLERMVAAMDAPGVAVVGSSRILPASSSRLQRRIAREVPRWEFPVLSEPVESDPPLHRYGFSDATTTCCLIRRDVIERVGGFDERLPTGEDTDLFYRIRRQGGRFVIPAAAWTYHSPPRRLDAFLRKCFRYGVGHAHEAQLQPGRRMDLLPLDRPWARLVLMAAPLIVPVTILLDIRLLPGLCIRPAFRPIQSIARVATLIGYAWGYFVPRD
jgi:glycosyl transferase family 2